MSGRIMELSYKTKLLTGSPNGEPAYQKIYTKLVVEECANWINDNVGLITQEARTDLYKHFGVEE